MRSQNTVLVNLPKVLQQDSDLTLVITYQVACRHRILTSTRSGEGKDRNNKPSPSDLTEPAFLLSNRAY
jgi:hypothetical protein